MAKSMTGYGTSQKKNNDYLIKIDIKSTNSRYFDLNIRGPRYIMAIEDDIKNIIASYISRGSIQAFIDVKFIGKSRPIFDIDYNLLSSYKQNLSQISKFMDIDKTYQVIDLLEYDNAILVKDDGQLIKDSSFIELLESTCQLACQSLLEMRIQEGYNIKTDILNKLDNMEVYVNKIDKYSEFIVKENIDKLKLRIKNILSEDNIDIDQDRLNNEIVFYSDKLTIDEEIIRLKSHIDLMRKSLDDEKSGKGLDFIAQEMNREANTIGSKSNKLEITNLVIDLKTNIEKIREQVQNIE